MATQPELAIFRRFQALHAQNLLYLQAELVELEARLREQALIDSKSQEQHEKLFSRDWRTLSTPNGPAQPSKQWSLALEVREKLEKYDMALLRQAQLSRLLQKPRKQDLDILAGNLEDPKLPDYLLGLDSSVWKDAETRLDLVSLHTVYEFHPATLCLIKMFLGLYHRFLGRRTKSTSNEDAQLFYYNNSHLEIPAHIISIVLASLLPVLSIVVLYLVDNMPKRLGLVAMFTALFSLSLAFMTKAKRADIFAATAAFAAVQVVFIGTNDPRVTGKVAGP